MKVFIEFIKTANEWLKNANVIIGLLDTMQKLKSKVVSIATLLIVISVFAVFFILPNDSFATDHYRMCIMVLLCWIVMLVIYIAVIFKRQKRETEALNMLKDSDSANQNLAKIEEQHIVFENIYRLLREYRNTINTIEKYHKSPKDNLADPITSSVYRFMRDALSSLTAIFECITKEKVSACIKCIVADNFEDIEYEDAYVKTFLRSSNTSTQRITYNDGHPAPVKLSDNTDFKEIISDNRTNPSSCFYQGNLKEYGQRLEEIGQKYENTTEDWEKYYVGTIVAPIRIANQHLFYKDKNEGYDILGFLCVDTESLNAFPKEREEDYTFIVRAFAAIMYNVLSKYQFYLTKIDRTDCYPPVGSNNVPEKGVKFVGGKKKNASKKRRK